MGAIKKKILSGLAITATAALCIARVAVAGITIDPPAVNGREAEYRVYISKRSGDMPWSAPEELPGAIEPEPGVEYRVIIKIMIRTDLSDVVRQLRELTGSESTEQSE